MSEPPTPQGAARPTPLSYATPDLPHAPPRSREPLALFMVGTLLTPVAYNVITALTSREEHDPAAACACIGVPGLLWAWATLYAGFCARVTRLRGFARVHLPGAFLCGLLYGGLPVLPPPDQHVTPWLALAFAIAFPFCAPRLFVRPFAPTFA
jgi:hypothetical protein